MGSLLEDIGYHDLQFEEIVGRGSFGVVYRAKWKGQTVAVKRAETETEVQSFRVEVRQLQRVCHPNIITIFGVSADETNPLCLIMEYADCGSLYQLLHGSENSPQYTCAHAINWLVQCAKGVAYLHSMKPKPLIHRDLKPPKEQLNGIINNMQILFCTVWNQPAPYRIDSILLTDSGRHCKICDFGTACEARTYLTNNRGSAAWMAPEVFESNKYTEKCDVFSFGIIIWEVLTRRRPYDEIGGNIYRIMWAIHRGIRPPSIRGCPAILETLMTKCWARLPGDRPRMVQAVKVLERVLKFMKGDEQPIRWKRSNQNISSLRSIEENSSSSRSKSTERAGIAMPTTPTSNVDTVLFRGDAMNDPGGVQSHSSTLNILPMVAAEPEPYVRYTTLIEHLNKPAQKDDHVSSSSHFSSTLEFNNSDPLTHSDDPGFVECAHPQAQQNLRFFARPSSLDVIRHPDLSFMHPNIQIEMRHTPAVHHVRSLTFNMSSDSGHAPATVIQRHYRIRSDPDEYSYTEDAGTDEDDACQTESFPSQTLFAR